MFSPRVGNLTDFSPLSLQGATTCTLCSAGYYNTIGACSGQRRPRPIIAYVLKLFGLSGIVILFARAEVPFAQQTSVSKYRVVRAGYHHWNLLTEELINFFGVGSSTCVACSAGTFNASTGMFSAFGFPGPIVVSDISLSFKYRHHTQQVQSRDFTDETHRDGCSAHFFQKLFTGTNRYD